MEKHTDGVALFYAKTRKAWRQWLHKNHSSEVSVWLIIYKKESGIPSVYYDEAVEEALCFGWIDSKPNKRDEQSFIQFFAKRKATSNWSKLNKTRVEKLLQQGLITQAGMEMIDIAKANGKWDALNEVDNLVIPPDMEQAFKSNKTAKQNFEAFPPSTIRGILEWILNAKRPETRQKRIDETIALAEKNIRANQYNPK
jgi:uncharacterized protein YdeI (YjbR/CyaY-like superfamily)